MTVRLPVAPHFLPAIGLGSIPGRCLLIQPVGSHRLVAMSSRRGPPCCKSINVQPGGSMSLNAKTKGNKMGVAPLMHSVPNVLVRHIVDAFQAGLLRIRQHNVPNGITNLAQSIGDAEPQDAVLHPSVVEALRGLIQDHLKDHIARGDLKKAGAPHLSLPKALAPFAAIASTCHTLLLLDHFPGADTAQNQATFHAPPEGMAPASRIALPHVVLPASGDHVVHSDGWFAFRLVVLAIVALNGDEWSRGMATLPCSRVRMTAMSWFLSQELGTLGCQVHMASKGVEVHGFNGGSGVAQLGIEGSCSRCINFSMPILRSVASPGHLHIHELICRKNGHNLIIDLWVTLEGFRREADSLITDGPHNHVFTVIRDWGHGNLHHYLWGVGQERPHGQELAKLTIALTPLCRGLGSSKVVGIQELLHLILGLLQVGLVFLGRFSLSPAGTLDHQGHLTPNAVQLLHGPSIAIDLEQGKQSPSLGLPLPVALLIIGSPKTTTDRLGAGRKPDSTCFFTSSSV